MASVGIGNSIYSSRILCKIEFLVNGVTVYEETYVDSDDSRDEIMYDYEGQGDDSLAIRFTGLEESYIQYDSSEPSRNVDYASGDWEADPSGQSGHFSSYVGSTTVVQGNEGHIVYTFII